MWPGNGTPGVFCVLLSLRPLLPLRPPPQASRQLIIRWRIKRERRTATFSHSGGSSHVDGLLSFDDVVNPCFFLSFSYVSLGWRLPVVLFCRFCSRLYLFVFSVSGENAGCDGPLRGWPCVSPFCSFWPGSPSLFGS